MFMVGAGYALMKGVHIRADFLYHTISERAQARVDLALYLVFYFPSLILFFWITKDYAWTAFVRGETSMNTAAGHPVSGKCAVPGHLSRRFALLRPARIPRLSAIEQRSDPDGPKSPATL